MDTILSLSENDICANQQSTSCATNIEHGDACTLIWNWTLGKNATQFIIL